MDVSTILFMAMVVVWHTKPVVRFNSFDKGDNYVDVNYLLSIVWKDIIQQETLSII